METDIGAGRPCVLVARSFHRHAHSSKFHSIHKAPAFVVSFRHCTLQLHNTILCLSSRFQEDTSQHAAGTRMTKVKFVLRRRCDFGQRFFVIGDDKLLGGWAPEAAIPMQWSEGHVWTLQLDLLSGTCTEFKILLKVDEEVVEWQPGPNHKLEVLNSVTSLLVFVSWPDGEDSLENETFQSLEMNDMRGTQEIMEITPSARSLSDIADNVENLNFKADATVHPDVYAKPKVEASNTDSESIISNAKQAAPAGVTAGDRSLIDEGISSNAKPSEEFLSLYPVPEAWYVQESHDIQANLDCKDPSPGLLDKNANGRTHTSASELSDNEEDKPGQKNFLSNHSNDWIAEAKSSEDNEHIRMEENGEQLTRSIPSNAGTELLAVELRDVQKGSAQNARTERDQTGSFAEPKEQHIADPAVLDREEPTSDEQVMVGNDPIEASAESSTVATTAKGSDFSSIQSEPFESVETRSAKIKRWGPKGWSKLWGAIVQGRIQE